MVVLKTGHGALSRCPNVQSPVKAKRKRLFGGDGRASKLFLILLLGLFLLLTTSATPVRAGDTWATKAPLPIALAGAGAGVINGKLYVAGGMLGYSPGFNNSLFMYDPAANTWTSKAPMPINESNMATGVIDGKLYVVGGSTNSMSACGGQTNSTGSYGAYCQTRQLSVYDPVTDTWTVKAPMPLGLSGDAAGVINGQLYVAGGSQMFQSGTTPERTLFVYDPGTNEWTSKSSMPTNRDGLAVGVIDGKLYAVGGMTGCCSSLATNEAYDPTTDTWSTKAPLPSGRNQVRGDVIDGILYVPGGVNPTGSGYTDTLFAYDPSADTWVAEASMPTAGAGFAVAAMNGLLYVTSGGTVSANPSATLFVYTPTFKVTFASSGLGGDATGTTLVSLTPSGGSCTGTTIPLTGGSVSCDGGTSLAFSFTDPVTSSVSGKQYRFTIANQSSPYLVTGPITITGTYVAQWEQTFQVSANVVDATGTVVTVNGVPVSAGSLPYSIWVDQGSSVTYSYADPVSSSVSGKRYSLTTPAPSPASGYTVDGTTYNVVTVTGTYQTQYLLTIETSGLASSSYPTKIYLGGSNVGTAYDSSPFTQWFDASATTGTIAVDDPVSGPTGTQYLFMSWGDSSIANPRPSVTMDGPKTFTADYKTQYLLTMVTNAGTTTPSAGDHWYNAGSVVTISATAPTAGAGEQYVWNGWTGSSSGSYTGTDNPASVTMDGPISETASWTHQFYLTVTSAYDSPSPVSGWFDSGASVTASVTSPVSGGAGIQYVCTGWSGTGSVPASGSSTSTTFTMNAPSTITWNWKTQYQITFDQTGVGADFTGTVVTVDGTNNYGVSTLPVSFWWDDSSVHSFAFQSPLVVAANTKQYVWTSTTGLSTLQSGSITVSGSGSVVGSYKTQYYLTMSTNFGSVTPTSGWQDAGSTVTITATAPAVADPSVERYVWVGWTGTGTGSYNGTANPATNAVTMSGPVGEAASWTHQYYLTTQVSPSGAGSTSPGSTWENAGTTLWISAAPANGYMFSSWAGTGSGSYSGPTQIAQVTINQPITETANFSPSTVSITITSTFTGSGFVTVDGSPITTPQTFTWIGASAHTVAAASPVSGGAGIQYVWLSWSDGGAQSHTYTVPTSPQTLTANYKTQYYLTVSSAHDTPTGAGWYDSGASAGFSVTTPTSGGTGTQYVFTGWSSSDTGGYTGTAASYSVTMNNPITETASWKTQYYLTVTSAHDSPTPASGWFDSGTPITASVTSPADQSGGTRYRCTGWSGTGSVPASGSSTSTTFTMNAPSTITWNWMTQYYLTVTSTQDTPTGAGWYDSGSTANFAMTATTVAGTAGTQYVFTGWSSSDTGGYTGSSSSSSVTMNNPITETASWKTQFYLTVSSVYDTATGAGWYDAGSLASFSVTTPVSGGTGTRYVFTGWTGSGTGQYTGSNNPGSVTMNNPITETASWKTQYYLTMHVNPSGSGSTIPTSGWQDSESKVTISATAVCGYAFSSWSGSGLGSYTGPSNPATNAVTMSGLITETANIPQLVYAACFVGSPTVAPNPVGQGSRMNFTVTVRNAGTSAMSSVTVQWKGYGPGRSPPGLTLGTAAIHSFASGTVTSVQIAYTLSTSAAVGTWTYGVYIYYGTTLLNQQTGLTFTVGTPVYTGSILSATESPKPVARGHAATFTVTVENTGNIYWPHATIIVKVYGPTHSLAISLTLTISNIMPNVPSGPYTLSWTVPSGAAPGAYTYDVFLYYGTTLLDSKKGNTMSVS